MPWVLDRAADGRGRVLTDRLNKFPLVLTFLVAYFVFFTLVSLVNPSGVAEMFREPFLQAALFLAFFMLTDPPTSPNRYGDQVWFGVLAALSPGMAQLLGRRAGLPAAGRAGGQRRAGGRPLRRADAADAPARPQQSRHALPVTRAIQLTRRSLPVCAGFPGGALAAAPWCPDRRLAACPRPRRLIRRNQSAKPRGWSSRRPQCRWAARHRSLAAGRS